MVGIFGAGTSAGQLLFFPFLTALSVTVGWRTGAVVLGAAALVLAIPVLIWLRNDPADVAAPQPAPKLRRRGFRTTKHRPVPGRRPR